MSARTRSRDQQAASAWSGGRRWLALGLAVVVAAAALLAGRFYLWCIPMQRAMATCCCHQEMSAGGSTAPAGAALADAARLRGACCEELAMAALPDASAADHAPPDVPPAPLAIARSAPSIEQARGTAPLRRAVSPSAHSPFPSRAGPTRASETCILLQIFRC